MSCACFYCNEPLTRAKTWDGAGPPPVNLRTTDHIFPRSAVKRMGCLYGERWRQLNRVNACPACNARKGNMSPLEWLPLIPDAFARQRFALRLAALGVPLVAFRDQYAPAREATEPVTARDSITEGQSWPVR